MVHFVCPAKHIKVDLVRTATNDKREGSGGKWRDVEGSGGMWREVEGNNENKHEQTILTSFSVLGECNLSLISNEEPFKKRKQTLYYSEEFTKNIFMYFKHSSRMRRWCVTCYVTSHAYLPTHKCSHATGD
jgi:hypothetical protein